MTMPRTSGTPIQSTSINLLASRRVRAIHDRFLAIARREGHDQHADQGGEEAGDAKLKEVERVDLPRHGRCLIGK